MTRPILVFGAGGRVGGALDAYASEHGHNIEGVQADITNVHETMYQVASTRPAAFINLAASTLPRAEEWPDGRAEASCVNGVAVLKLAHIAAALGVPLIHISTDCVFDGLKDEPYAPTDAPSPVNWYGDTKRIGEVCIARVDVPHIIIRTTGVYLADKPNFLKLVLDKARAGGELTVVSDSIYTPTDARELAKAILLATERVIEDPSVSGTYHFAGPDVMSYLDFAKLVQEEAGLSAPLMPTTMAEREKIEGFKRPKNAALNSDKFAEVFGLRHRPTRECVRELVQPR
jgi:dTDP-4-dehydrorhamnose reductase